MVDPLNFFFLVCLTLELLLDARGRYITIFYLPLHCTWLVCVHRRPPSSGSCPPQLKFGACLMQNYLVPYFLTPSAATTFDFWVLLSPCFPNISFTSIMLIAFNSNSMLILFFFLLVIVNLLLQPKFLKQNSCLTFCSRKLNAVVRSRLFLCLLFNLFNIY